MSKLTCCLLGIICIASNAKAQQSFWSKSQTTQANFKSIAGKYPVNTLISRLDVSTFKTLLKSAPLERSGKFVSGTPFNFPLPNGEVLKTSIIESPLWEEHSASPSVGIKTYLLANPITNSLDGRITVTPLGISGVLFAGDGLVYINPITSGDEGDHALYYTKDVEAGTIKCGTKDGGSPALYNANRTTAGDGKARVYRLAIAATAEYTAWAGSQADAITYMTITINNINAIYSRDLNVRLTIVTSNDILFTDPATDPYTQPAGWEIPVTNANQTVLDNAIGSGNYDVGMVFNKGWDKGYAPTGIVCKPTEKGKSGAGYSLGKGLNPVDGPQGPVFDFTVAHEMGHDFGAAHTMASNAGFCAPYGNAVTAFEPGAGNTIMSYAGYSDCGAYVNYIEPYFHAGTIAQIQSYILGQACGAVSNISNSSPVVSVPAAAYNVPISTPFTLSGSGYDAEGNSLVFNWEQMNGAFTVTPPPSTNAAGPNFRSYPPAVNGNVRTFPRMVDIAANVSPLYEVLPSVNRTMNFRLTARDQSAFGGGTGEANVTVNFFNTAGPFTVTSQPSAVTWAANGSNTQTITWNVAGTNAGSVNCAAVSIMLSTDGGLTYPYTLLSSTPNDGSEVITVPNVATQAGRIKVQGVNNIFFNINKANITITTSCVAQGSTIAPLDSVIAPAGHASLNLPLLPQYGSAFTPTGTITAANPSTPLPINKTDLPGCAYYSGYNTFKYNVHPFVVNTAGNYTFTWPSPTPYGLVYNLYYESFNPTFPCINFIASNTVTSVNPPVPTTINPNMTVNLSPGVRYVLVVGTFSATFPTLPATYSVSVSNGGVYNNPPSPGAAFTYMYVVVDNATNLIKAIASTADLTNSSTYPAETSYTIYGMSYSNSSPSLAGYVGGNYATLSTALLNDATLCGNISKNSVRVKVVRPTYTFNGTGNWSVAANWLNNAIPPSPLPQGAEIIVDPVGTSESVINIPMTLRPGASLTIGAGKKLRVVGNLLIQQ